MWHGGWRRRRGMSRPRGVTSPRPPSCRGGRWRRCVPPPRRSNSRPTAGTLGATSIMVSRRAVVGRRTREAGPAMVEPGNLQRPSVRLVSCRDAVGRWRTVIVFGDRCGVVLVAPAGETAVLSPADVATLHAALDHAVNQHHHLHREPSHEGRKRFRYAYGSTSWCRGCVVAARAAHASSGQCSCPTVACGQRASRRLRALHQPDQSRNATDSRLWYPAYRLSTPPEPIRA